jgi:hypothetical protein
VVAITHDRYFLEELTGWILELDRGAGFPYEGNYSGWLEQKANRIEQEGACVYVWVSGHGLCVKVGVDISHPRGSGARRRDMMLGVGEAHAVLS